VIIPIQMGLLGHSGQSLSMKQTPDGVAVEECCVVVQNEEYSVTFYDVHELPVPALLRGFSAPVYLKTPFSMRDWLHIVRYEKDACVRDGALNVVVRHCVQARMNDLPDTSVELQWLDIMGEWLHSERALKEPGVIAHLLTLPTISTLAEFFDVIQPVQLVRVRQELERLIMQTHQALLEALYETVQEHVRQLSMEPYDFSAWATGLRALRSRILSYLTVEGDMVALQRACRQYDEARCLSDRVGALSALNRQHSVYRAQCLDHFHQFYQQEPLVLDKAWALEAACPDAGTFERIQTIWAASTFDRRNPNRVRSLLYTFGHQNWAYRFMCDVLCELDRSNPNLAARLVTVFSRWSRFAEPLKQHQKEILEFLQSQCHSANVKELLGKYLNVEHA
jgi:aminopeptidase N